MSSARLTGHRFQLPVAIVDESKNTYMFLTPFRPYAHFHQDSRPLILLNVEVQVSTRGISLEIRI